MASILASSLVPEEIVIIGRKGDVETERWIEALTGTQKEHVHLRSAWVEEPGHMPPIQEGVRAASTDLVAIVDDDVTVSRDWLSRLVAPFADPKVGVAGGRVITQFALLPRLKGKPGCTSWYGRHWGNVGCLQGESPVEVHAVMEGNCAWRRNLLMSLQFDTVLNFDDASMYGLDLCLQAREAGMKVVYEPRAIVHHHAAPRSPDLDRTERPRRAFSYTRNYTYIMLKHLARWQRPIFLAWWFLLGERGSGGLAAVVADLISGDPPRARNVRSMLKGKLEGIRLSLLGKA